jgi:predicted nuclease of restriction endonuclease-like (RecB) superfamily
MRTNKRAPAVRGKIALFQEIKNLIISARTSVARNINTVQVITGFEIGRRIIEEEQRGTTRAEYGKQIIADLSTALTAEFGSGFSERNLRNMRKFFLTYKDRSDKIRQTPSAKLSAVPEIFPLSWSQYVFLIGIKEPQERSFYEIETAQNGWTLPELERQFNSGLYERLALSRNKNAIRRLSREGQKIENTNDLMKNPYVLEFLGLEEKSEFSESDLEAAIIDKIENFLLELGKGFLFEARQRRFTFDEDHFFIDLVFYNRLLNCYVLVDLKIGKLTHQDLGQMQMYVNYFDRFIKRDVENPTVGIILCRKKHDALVEITLPKKSNIHAAEYQLYIPDKEVLRKKLLDWTSGSKGKEGK